MWAVTPPPMMTSPPQSLIHGQTDNIVQVTLDLNRWVRTRYFQFSHCWRVSSQSAAGSHFQSKQEGRGQGAPTRRLLYVGSVTLSGRAAVFRWGRTPPPASAVNTSPSDSFYKHVLFTPDDAHILTHRHTSARHILGDPLRTHRADLFVGPAAMKEPFTVLPRPSCVPQEGED